MLLFIVFFEMPGVAGRIEADNTIRTENVYAGGLAARENCEPQAGWTTSGQSKHQPRRGDGQ